MSAPKPPIGASPHFWVLKQRMIELSGAIERYLQYNEEDYKRRYAEQKYECIAMWAEELKTLATLEAELLKMERSKGAEL